jgi:hypothetical protein
MDEVRCSTCVLYFLMHCAIPDLDGNKQSGEIQKREHNMEKT